MTIRPPLIDPRTPKQIEEQTRSLLRQYLSGPPYNWQSTDNGGEAGKALTGIFAHYCGLIIDRINRAPEKNFLAFLDLLGNSPLPPRPAQVPLTFLLDQSVTEGMTVPAGTRVQAEPGEGASEPLLFETERDLWLTTFELKAFAKEFPNNSTLEDLTALIKTFKDTGGQHHEAEKIFAQPSTYLFGLDLVDGRVLPANRPVSLYLFVGNPVYDPTTKDVLPERQLRWEYSSSPTGSWTELLIEDGTQGFTRSGSVEFLVPKDFSQIEYDLRLRKVGLATDLPNEGRRLVIVALVGTSLHIRIFDANGKKIVDKAESELRGGPTLTALKGQLDPFPDDSRLSQEQKRQIIQNATVVSAYTPEANLFWIRASLPERTPPVGESLDLPLPILTGVALNTVIAQQAMSVQDEILGSSNGNSGQTFSTFRKPILPGQQVEVLERRATVAGTAGADREDWVPWQEVQDFHLSEPLDRHYLVDRQAGQVRFGDGRAGQVPPIGSRNVRITYRTGGGRAGNVAARTITTLVAGGKLIENVTNFVPAAGGADAETPDALLERAPRSLRHRGRAVTVEDYEDLAKLASPEVARALCVPLIDLAQAPSKVSTPQDGDAGAGMVSVIIVPRSDAANPLPTQTLMRQVASYLRENSLATTSISVVGPLYLRVNIKVSIILRSIRYDAQVKRELHQAFTTFLHPLTGRYGQGWPFGRQPHESDIHRLIRGVAGVDYVESILIEPAPDGRPFDGERIEKTGRFLIYSGQHTVTTKTSKS